MSTMHTPRALAPVLLAFLATIAIACAGADEPRERIVLITLDTLRQDSFLGPTAAMPLARERARSGRVFERYYSATTSTQPTHATLLTGLHPWQHGVPRNGLVLAAND